ncbi:hypothetical protein R6Q59_003710 [Mikania micrantha]
MSKSWSWMDDVLPFVAMLMINCSDMAVLTIIKAAMNDGMHSIVYVTYHNALGTLLLLPFFIVHTLRKVDRPPLTFRIIFRFFILGLFGICISEVLVYAGVSYSSPTMLSAISNLAPGVTFLIAVVFRMEQIDIRRASSVAKLLGTMMAISGVMVFTFYQGPYIFRSTRSINLSGQVFSSQPSTRVFAALIITTGGIFGCIWSVLQAKTAREYPNQNTILFFYSLFGTLQCIAISPFLERNRSAWVLQHGTFVSAVVLGAVYSTVIHNLVVTWCLRKNGPVFVAMFSPLSIVIAMIMGVAFLGDSLRLGSAIGATIVVVGFYMVIWGQIKEKNKMSVITRDDLNISNEHEYSDQTTTLI